MMDRGAECSMQDARRTRHFRATTACQRYAHESGKGMVGERGTEDVHAGVRLLSCWQAWVPKMPQQDRGMFRVFLARSGECECVVHEGLMGGQR
jgi:hypothetical protein